MTQSEADVLRKMRDILLRKLEHYSFADMGGLREYMAEIQKLNAQIRALEINAPIVFVKKEEA